jgi:hypothetical protein
MDWFDALRKGPQAGGAQRDRVRLPSVLAVMLVMFSSPNTLADSRGGSTASLGRCWYVVEETVVPVNLPQVTVRVVPTSDHAMRRVSFRDVAKPRQLITEAVVSPERAQELMDALAHRRNECASAAQP